MKLVVLPGGEHGAERGPGLGADEGHAAELDLHLAGADVVVEQVREHVDGEGGAVGALEVRVLDERERRLGRAERGAVLGDACQQRAVVARTGERISRRRAVRAAEPAHEHERGDDDGRHGDSADQELSTGEAPRLGRRPARLRRLALAVLGRAVAAAGARLRPLRARRLRRGWTAVRRHVRSVDAPRSRRLRTGAQSTCGKSRIRPADQAWGSTPRIPRARCVLFRL
jgi:hypothetical protein